MQERKNLWSNPLTGPFLWLACYFFQPDRFMRKMEVELRTHRLKLLLKLALPMFIVCYLPVLGLQLFFNFSYFTSNWIVFSLTSALGCLLGVAIGIIWDLLANLWVGIVGGIWIGIVTGIWINGFWQLNSIVMFTNNSALITTTWGYSWQIVIGILITTIGGLTLGAGLQSFTPEHFSNAANHFSVIFDEPMNNGKDLWKFVSKLVGTIAVVMAGGRGGYAKRYYARRIGTVLLLSIFGAILVQPIITTMGSVSNFAGTFLLEGLIVIPAGVLSGISLFFAKKRIAGIAIGVGGGILVGGCGYGAWTDMFTICICIATALAWSGGLLLGLRYMLARAKLRSSLAALLTGIIVGCVAGLCTGGIIFIPFLMYYILSYCCLPLYPANIVASVNAYTASENDPEQVFTHLRKSPLYWDEHTSLSFPFMEKCLVIATKQDTEQTMQEITFIAARNHHSVWIAQAGLLEIIIQGLEMREDTLEPRRWLHDIVDAAAYLAPFLWETDTILDSSLASIFTSTWAARLASASLAIEDARRFSVSLGWQTRQDALNSMLSHLEKASNMGSRSGFNALNKFEQNFNERLDAVMKDWILTAEYELSRLDQEPHTTNHIYNPYVVGPPLDEPGTSLFVGRRDLAQQLEEVLGKSSHRTTFFLLGERRMGKTSTLKQLPSLLDTRRFLPVFYDLLAPEVISSAPAFLMMVADALSSAMGEKGIQIKALETKRLEEASQKNEAAVYFALNEWLKGVEMVLERNDQVALLSFDEFERLEKVRQGGYFDLDLLFNWFRSILQNRPRFALLFSGGKTFEEMQAQTGTDWSGYFVHVQMLKVSFLQHKETLQLITHPRPDYPIAQIFGEGVADEIITLTNGHPFLVQATCSALVGNLNAHDRDRAVREDVAIAVNDMLETWWGNYFQDLWNRTDPEQRACLIALHEMNEADLQEIMEHVRQQQEPSQVSLLALRRALRTLIQRDLILQKEDNYRITAPIFSEWVKRNR